MSPRLTGSDRFLLRQAEADAKLARLRAEREEKARLAAVREEARLARLRARVPVEQAEGPPGKYRRLRSNDPRVVGRDTSGVCYTEDTKVVTCAWCAGVAVAGTATRIDGRPYCPACLSSVPTDAYLSKHDLPIYSLGNAVKNAACLAHDL
jgi:hypothetical protein